VRRERLGEGTGNLARTQAMTQDQTAAALRIGREAARRAQGAGARLLIAGEMGIANSTSAAALGAALLGLPAASLVGPGTGLDSAGVAHKTRCVESALALHQGPDRSPLELLQRLGGFELAALAGAYLGAAQCGLPTLVDGFIATAAALAACRLNPGTADWLIFAHRSAEPGHALLLAALEAEPLLELGMRLGEGSGAALAVPVLRLACALHAGMATFDEAGIAGR
jgi:nicotinate-nucleotide--dimethylbenzimidazole phosphoribosyltransferase